MIDVPKQSEAEILAEQLLKLTTKVEKMEKMCAELSVNIEGAVMEVNTLQKWLTEMEKRGGFVHRV